MSNRYQRGEFAITPVEVVPGPGLTIRVGPRKGSFQGMGKSLSCQVVIHNAEQPSKVLLNGAALQEISSQAADQFKTRGFFHDALKKLLVVNAAAAEAGLTIEAIK